MLLPPSPPLPLPLPLHQPLPLSLLLPLANCLTRPLITLRGKLLLKLGNLPSLLRHSATQATTQFHRSLPQLLPLPQ